MATTRTDGTDPSKAVVEQMIAEKRRRKNQPKPKTVISEEQAVQGSTEQGGPNPNDEVRPPEFRRPAEDEATEAAEVVEDDSEATEGDSEGVEDLGAGTGEDDQQPAEEEELDRPDDTFGSKGAWLAYRLANGYTEDELKGLGRNKLRDLDDR